MPVGRKPRDSTHRPGACGDEQITTSDPEHNRVSPDQAGLFPAIEPSSFRLECERSITCQSARNQDAPERQPPRREFQIIGRRRHRRSIGPHAQLHVSRGFDQIEWLSGRERSWRPLA